MKNEFETSFIDVSVIDATKEGMDSYGYGYGSSRLVINQELLTELLNGKAIAVDDGEYRAFIMLDDDVVLQA